MLRTDESVDPMSHDSQDVLKECQRLRRAGDSEAAARLLHDALRRRAFDATRFHTAGRALQRLLPQVDAEPLEIHILSQCTAEGLAASLTAEAWSHHVAVAAQTGDYDAILQNLQDLPSSTAVLVLLPWHQRVLGSENLSSEERIASELAMWQQAWDLVPQDVRVIQVGYDWISPGALGHHLSARTDGDIRMIRQLNKELRQQLPSHHFLVDLEQVSANLGRRSFYDARNYAWTKQPFTMDGAQLLARHVWSGVRALLTGPKKVLVVDLDDTLWGGIVGERGPHGIELGDSPEGESFRSFQRFLKQLRARGVLLAVCSKNNEQDAREPFLVNRDMILQLEDFACFEASWEPKPAVIQQIASKLRLGIESFVFFDDSPVEREAVRQQLPTVGVVDVPEEVAEYVTALEDGLWFEAISLTQADQERAAQYDAERQRRTAIESAQTVPDYLRSLGMKANVKEIDELDLKRIVQLLGKTNQFNLTTKRHTEEQVRSFMRATGGLSISLRLRDRFGDYGLISVVLGEAVADATTPTLRIDTWLMSCRAIGRTVESYLLNQVIQRAREMGYQQILGEYRPTAKNAQVESFFPEHGFSVSASDGDSTWFTLTLADFDRCLTYVESA